MNIGRQVEVGNECCYFFLTASLAPPKDTEHSSLVLWPLISGVLLVVMNNFSHAFAQC